MSMIMASHFQYAPYSPLSNFEISEGNGDCWDLCQLCAFRLDNCMCLANANTSLGIGTSSGGPFPSLTSSTIESSFTERSYDKFYTPSEATSTLLWNSAFPTIYEISTDVEYPWRASSEQGGVENEVSRDSSRSSSSPEASSISTAPKKGKKKSLLSPEDSREKRMQQNRESQRSFRGRQAKLIQNLRQEVQDLREENEKLTIELTGKLGSMKIQKFESPSEKESSLGGNGSSKQGKN